MKEPTISFEFHCPKCGSTMFGSSGHAKGPVTYHCSGNEQWTCKFTCPLEDFWKYRVKITTEAFSSREEHDAADRGEDEQIAQAPRSAYPDTAGRGPIL